MPIFDLALPDGRTLTLEAPNEQSALSAATEWHAANPKTAQNKGYGENFAEMATESAGQLGRGVGQLHNAWDFATSGAGRNVVPDTPANRIAGGFSALDPSGPQAPLTTSEHRAANRQAIGDLVRGFGNTVFGALGTAYSPINAAMRTYVGQPVESATGSKGAGTAAEITTGLFGPQAVTRAARFVGRTIAAKPSFEKIEEAATAGFRSPEVRNLEVKPDAPQAWANSLRTKLTDDGRSDITAPQTWRILSRLDNVPPGATVTGNNLASIRKELQAVAKETKDFKATEDASAATAAIKELDKFIVSGISPRDVIRGDPVAAQRVWNEARGNWAQTAKIRAADRRQIEADARANSSYSGLNFDNTMRQKMRDVATGPAGRGFNRPGERGAVERVVYGSPERNALRVGSSMLGGGGGIGATGVGALGTAATAGSAVPFWGAAAPFVGMGLRVVQNALTARDMDKLNVVLRANSPLARQQGGVRQDVALPLIAANIPPWFSNAVALQLLSRSSPFSGE